MTFVRDRIVQAAITKLVTSLNPAGAFIQAIIAIYNTIMFFVERLRQIAQVVGVVHRLHLRHRRRRHRRRRQPRRADHGRPADAGDQLPGPPRRPGQGERRRRQHRQPIRAPIDRALDRVVEWIVATARRLRKALFGQRQGATAAAAGGAPADGELGRRAVRSRRRGRPTLGGCQGRKHPGHAGQHSQAVVRPPGGVPEPWPEIFEAGDTKTNVLGWISSALPLARTIEADARRAASRTIDTPARNAIDQQIEANEQLLRPLLANILDALGIRVPAQITPQEHMQLTTQPGIDAGEYSRQLAMQQSAIVMVVEDWLANRMRFAERRALTGTSGRHPESRTAQQDLRALHRSAAINRLMRGANAAGASVAFTDPHLSAFVVSVFARYSETTRRNGLAESTATREVAAWMSTQHALHSPDQVAGGRHDQLTGLGSGWVNMDIGSNWGGWGDKPAHLANQLERGHARCHAETEREACVLAPGAYECLTSYVRDHHVTFEEKELSGTRLPQGFSARGSLSAVHQSPVECYFRLAKRIPAVMREILKKEGWCSYKEQVLWLTDPDDWTVSARAWFSDTADARQVFVRTAFGDLFVWDGQVYWYAMVHESIVARSDDDPNWFFSRTLPDKGFAPNTHLPPRVKAARKVAGSLEWDEMYAYVPALALGGSEKTSRIDRVKAREALVLLAGLAPVRRT